MLAVGPLEGVDEKLRAIQGLFRSIKRSNDLVKYFHCDICGRSYVAKGHLMAHKIFNHSQPSPIICKECPICKKTVNCVTNTADLGAHIEQHLTDRRKFYCEKCSKSFYKNSHLTRHRRTAHHNK